MITLSQAKEIFKLVVNDYDSIEMEEVNIYVGDVFCYTSCLLMKHEIQIKNTFDNPKEMEVVRLIQNKGIKDEFCMMDGINEVIALLHEIGHLWNTVLYGSIDNTGYKEFKERTYYSMSQANKAYRDIPAENFADMFAVDFINNNGKEIWKIMHPEMSMDEINEWIEIFK